MTLYFHEWARENKREKWMGKDTDNIITNNESATYKDKAS